MENNLRKLAEIAGFLCCIGGIIVVIFGIVDIAHPGPINHIITVYSGDSEVKTFVSYGRVSYINGLWEFTEREHLQKIRVSGTVIVEPAK